MELSQWYEYQLQSTLDGFIWAARQVPRERFDVPPPAPLGEWSAAQHVAHMLEYEEKLALPTMYQWLGAPAVIREGEAGQEGGNPPPREEMLARFEQVRGMEIQLLGRFEHGLWDSNRKTTFWGEVSLSWLVGKTYQHTLEHTHDILRLVLFWDRILGRMAG